MVDLETVIATLFCLYLNIRTLLHAANSFFLSPNSFFKQLFFQLFLQSVCLRNEVSVLPTLSLFQCVFVI